MKSQKTHAASGAARGEERKIKRERERERNKEEKEVVRIGKANMARNGSGGC